MDDVTREHLANLEKRVARLELRVNTLGACVRRLQEFAGEVGGFLAAKFGGEKTPTLNLDLPKDPQ